MKPLDLSADRQVLAKTKIAEVGGKRGTNLNVTLSPAK